jgi:hypothetical protein
MMLKLNAGTRKGKCCGKFLARLGDSEPLSIFAIEAALRGFFRIV